MRREVTGERDERAPPSPVPAPTPAPTPSGRDPAGFIGSAMLPSIPIGLIAAAIGHWVMAEPLLVWAGLVLAGANLLGLVGFFFWYRQRERRRRRDWQLHVWQHGEDREEP